MKKSSLLLLMVLICFPQLSETIYTPALPVLGEFFHASNALTQWTLTIYFVGFALGVGFWGYYSDRVGRRLAIIRGMMIYLASCVACALSTSIYMFLCFRLVQGFGISIGSVVVQSILREVYGEKERHKIFSLINIFMAFSPACGPLIGGYLAQWFNWQSNFWFLVTSGSLLLGAIYAYLKETNANIGTHINRDKVLATVKSMAGNSRVISFVILVGLFNGVMFSYYSQAPFIFIDLLGLTPGQYGQLGIFPALGVVAGSLISKKFGSHYSPETLLRWGCVGAFISILLLNGGLIFYLFLPLSNISAIFLVAFPMFLFFIAFSLAIPSLLGTALTGYESAIGIASSIFGFSYYIFTAFFNFLMGYLDNQTMAPMPLYFLSLSVLMLGTFQMFKKKTTKPKESYEADRYRSDYL